MNLREYFRELAFPLTSSATLVALVTFTLLLALASAAGLLGLWLEVAVVPALLRYLAMIAEARARGTEAATPGIEYFTLVGNAWTLFPVIPVGVAAYLVHTTAEAAGDMAGACVGLLSAALLPAMIGVLIVTRAPLQSLNPRVLLHFIARCGVAYAYAPLTAVVVVLLPGLLGFLPAIARDAIALTGAAAFFAVTGAITRGSGVFDDVETPAAAEPDAGEMQRRLERRRSSVLNHAYGFVSRGNRDGGLAHIRDWLARDPEPDTAWGWFLERMLRWQESYPALLLAQHYLARLLEHNEQVAAVKLMLRCRLVDEAFRPLPGDLPRAIAAARACRNEDLASALSRQ